MSITTSADTPLALAHEVAPDWAAGVFQFYSYQQATNRTENGREQRVAFRKNPRKAMTYTVSSARAGADSINLLQAIENRAELPVSVPWWPEGLRISVNMSDADSAQLEVAPGIKQGFDAGDTILLGDTLREIASRTDKFLTLVTGVGQVEVAGTWGYPIRLAVLQDPGEALAAIRHNKFDQRLRFEALA